MKLADFGLARIFKRAADIKPSGGSFIGGSASGGGSSSNASTPASTPTKTPQQDTDNATDFEIISEAEAEDDEKRRLLRSPARARATSVVDLQNTPTTPPAPPAPKKMGSALVPPINIQVMGTPESAGSGSGGRNRSSTSGDVRASKKFMHPLLTLFSADTQAGRRLYAEAIVRRSKVGH